MKNISMGIVALSAVAVFASARTTEAGVAAGEGRRQAVSRSGEAVQAEACDTLGLVRMRDAALQGDVAACRGLGDCFMDGESGVRNLRVAQNWYRRAAARGDAEAQRSLGLSWLALGDGLEPPRENDCRNAVYWLEKAALQGDTVAAGQLAELRREGYEAAAAELPGDTVLVGRMTRGEERPEDFARLLAAFDEAAVRGTRLITPQDPQHGVVVGRTGFESLRNELLYGSRYGAPTYRAALDSLRAHHTIRTLHDMGRDYMLMVLQNAYDRQRPDWEAPRRIDSRRYEVMERNTLSIYVVDRRGSAAGRVVRRPPECVAAAEPTVR